MGFRCGHVAGLLFGGRLQLLIGRLGPARKQLGQLLEVDAGQVHAPARFIALDDRRGDGHTLDLLVEQGLDLRRHRGDVDGSELAADGLREDVEGSDGPEVGSSSLVRQERLVGPCSGPCEAEELAPSLVR